MKADVDTAQLNISPALETGVKLHPFSPFNYYNQGPGINQITS